LRLEELSRLAKVVREERRPDYYQEQRGAIGPLTIHFAESFEAE
jgi:hypothetical protein